MAYFEERVVHQRELDLLEAFHRNNWLRPEVEAKLATLDLSLPAHKDLHRLVSLSLALMEAVDAHRYKPPPHWKELEPWLHRALAYFVNHRDAIPDHFEDGLDDDHREFRQLEERLGGMLDHFEVWQKRHRHR